MTLTIVAIPGVVCLAQGHSGDNSNLAWLKLTKVLPPQRFSHRVVVTRLCMACYLCACYDTIHPNMWPYDAKTVRIFITQKFCNPFSDPPALCTELTTDLSHGLRVVNKTLVFWGAPGPCVFHIVPDKRTSVRFKCCFKYILP